MKAMRAEIAAIPLATLARLNHHARAPYAPAKFAIYAYKTLAAHVLADAKQLSVRLVRWQGRCNRCTNGRYWLYYDEHEKRDVTAHCRHCGGTGKRTLRFTETTLPDGQIWHHPWEGIVASGYNLARAVNITWDSKTDSYFAENGVPAEWHDAAEWRPGLPAQKMTIVELVPLLNEVEDWVEAVGNRARGAPYWYSWSAAYSYTIDIGDLANGCHVCGTAENLEDYRRCCLTPTLRWTVQVCKAHSKSPFPTDEPPAELITPDIRRWLDRHEKVEVVR